MSSEIVLGTPKVVVRDSSKKRTNNGRILSRSTEIIIHPDMKRQRVTKLVLTGPVIRWRGESNFRIHSQDEPRYEFWCKTRHVTISTVVLGIYIETMAFPGHVNFFQHSRAFGFALDCERVYPTDEDLSNTDILVAKILSQEERMIRRLSKGCKRSWSH